MLFQFNLYSCLLLIFFFHLLVYALLFFVKGLKQGHLSDKLMSWFLFTAALLITPFMVGFAGWYDNQPYRDILFFVPFVHSLAIGPLLYFYTKSMFNQGFKISGISWLHFVPAILYFVGTTAISLVDFFYYEAYHLTNEHEDPDFAGWYTVLSTASILIYLLLSIRNYNQYKKYAAFTTSFAEQVSLKWLRNFLYAFALLSVMPIIREILSNFAFFERMRYFGPWYYYVGFAIVVYYIAINAYQATGGPLRKIEFESALLLELEPVVHPPVADVNDIPATALSQKELSLKNLLHELMEEQLLFERPDLTLAEVAKKLNTNVVVVSRLVNEQFSLNFNDYINKYRVEAVIKRIGLPEFRNQTLLSIAYDAGFNSKATFNRAFKKFTGKNPKDYLTKPE